MKKKLKWILEKEFSFDAAHKLENMPKDHKCGQLHGHTWRVIVRVASYHLKMPQQWVIDFGELKPMVEDVLRAFDHDYLNTKMQDNPTCEILAMNIYRQIAEKLGPSKIRFLDSITVYETVGNGCTFRVEEESA